MNATRRSFGTKEDLALALAEAVAGHLNDGIEARGRAVLAVSGGSTPGRFFSVLGRRKDIDWDKVYVTLVDERWVPETSPRSNAALVNEKLLQGPAASAHFVPLYTGGDDPGCRRDRPHQHRRQRPAGALRRRHPRHGQ